MRLCLQIADRRRQLDGIRSELTAEETSQHALRNDLRDVTGRLEEDVLELRSTVERLSTRLERLDYAGRPMSDDELDDQEFDERVESAAFWAEWRQRRDDTRGQSRPIDRGGRSASRKVNEKLRQLYRRLARKIHPDLALDAESRVRREAVMRLANIAYEANDQSQLERLIAMWAEESEESAPYALDELRAERERLERLIETVSEQLREAKDSDLGRLLRMSEQGRRRHLQRERERLRRDLANLRLRRRRLQRTLDSKRDKFTEVSD
ncbi:MAG: molecular chaperone DnaJ [Chloroflexota bacterium]